MDKKLNKICNIELYWSKQEVFMFFFMLKERLEENAGRQLSCRLIPNSLIRTSPVQVSEVIVTANMMLS